MGAALAAAAVVELVGVLLAAVAVAAVGFGTESEAGVGTNCMVWGAALFLSVASRFWIMGMIMAPMGLDMTSLGRFSISRGSRPRATACLLEMLLQMKKLVRSGPWQWWS